MLTTLLIQTDHHLFIMLYLINLLILSSSPLHTVGHTFTGLQVRVRLLVRLEKGTWDLGWTEGGHDKLRV